VGLPGFLESCLQSEYLTYWFVKFPACGYYHFQGFPLIAVANWFDPKFYPLLSFDSPSESLTYQVSVSRDTFDLFEVFMPYSVFSRIRTNFRATLPGLPFVALAGFD
jgi:hypothetical protein